MMNSPATGRRHHQLTSITCCFGEDLPFMFTKFPSQKHNCPFSHVMHAFLGALFCSLGSKDRCKTPFSSPAQKHLCGMAFLITGFLRLHRQSTCER
jgi:hypothetical protein